MGEHDGQALIHASGLVKRFGELVAVDAIDFDLRRGEAFGFLGPNSPALAKSEWLDERVFTFNLREMNDFAGFSAVLKHKLDRCPCLGAWIGSFAGETRVPRTPHPS